MQSAGKSFAIIPEAVTQEVVLDNLSMPGNPKRPTANNEFIGYMPGRFIPLGIVYVFNDGTTSPVYHIPLVIIMGLYLQYTSRGNCGRPNYWGALEGTPIRHFKFPERNAGTPMVTKTEGTMEYIDYYTFSFTHVLETYSYIQ